MRKKITRHQVEQYAALLLVANDASFEWMVHELMYLLEHYGAKKIGIEHPNVRDNLRSIDIPAPPYPKIRLSHLLERKKSPI